MDFEKATIKKTAVSILPPWAEQENEQCNSSSTSHLHQDSVDIDIHSSSHESTSALLPHSSSDCSGSYFGYKTNSKPSLNTSCDKAIHNATDNNNINSSRGSRGSSSNHTNGNVNGRPPESTYSQGPLSNSSIQRQSQKSLAEPYSSSSQSYQQQDWSVFATMSNVSTISGFSQRNSLLDNGTTTTSPFVSTDSMQKSSLNAVNNKVSNQNYHGKRPIIMELFNNKNNSNNDTSNSKSISTSTMGLQQQHVPTDSIDINNNTDDVTTTIPDYHQVCTCTCTQHRRAGSDGRLSLSSASFKKRKEKELRESRRGYPTGQCISTTTPPEGTNWDEKDSDLLQTHPRNTTKNTAFNLEALKAFLNSPLFSNFLKSYTIMASASLFAISLSSLILAKNAQDDNQQQQQHSDQLSNGNAALIVIVTLSLMTILYSCFTIFLESRRPPEGLDSSNSKPLIVIFSEIIASIIWSQLLGITIYIYIWTYGCTTESRIQIQTIWKLNQADNELTDKLCRRQAAMVGLELLLVLLLIFNFYTHLAQNFKFIRAVS